MAFFESKERREERLAEEARTEEQQREKEMMEREAEWETEKNDYLKSIQEEIDDGDKIICIQQTDSDIKQAVMNYLLEKGFVCVQNEVVANKWDVYHVATFVKNELVGKFFLK